MRERRPVNWIAGHVVGEEACDLPARCIGDNEVVQDGVAKSGVQHGAVVDARSADIAAVPEK